MELLTNKHKQVIIYFKNLLCFPVDCMIFLFPPYERVIDPNNDGAKLWWFKLCCSCVFNMQYAPNHQFLPYNIIYQLVENWMTRSIFIFEILKNNTHTQKVIIRDESLLLFWYCLFQEICTKQLVFTMWYHILNCSKLYLDMHLYVWKIIMLFIQRKDND